MFSICARLIASMIHKTCPKMPQHTPNIGQHSPNTLQDGPKIGSKWGQDEPNMVQVGSKLFHIGSMLLSFWLKNMVFHSMLA